MFSHESWIDFDDLIERQYKNPAEYEEGDDEDEIDED